MAAGAILGGSLGSAAATKAAALWFTAHVADPIGTLFLRLLLVLVIPLVVSSVALGVFAMGDLGRLGRVGLRCLVYTAVISAIAVLIGLVLTNVIAPGKRIDPETAAHLRQAYSAEADERVASAAAHTQGKAPLRVVVETLVPTNPVGAAASTPVDMLGLMFVTMFLAAAIASLREPKPLVDVLEVVYQGTTRAVEWVMSLAPYAVFGLVFAMASRFGFELLLSLGWYVGTVLLGLSIHMFVVYPLSVRFLSKLDPRDFFRRIETVLLTAFSTSSSAATLPTAIKASEERLGVPRELGGLVLTVGATANQNGTALFEGVTVLFLAQLAGVELSMVQQLSVLYLAILGGIGTAGVPAGSIPFVVVVLTTVGVNPGLIALILGVDRLLDMCRTTLNVAGDLTLATWIARSEGRLATLPTEKEHAA